MAKYWLTVLFGGVTGALGWMIKRLQRKLRAQKLEQENQKKKQELIQDAMIALLYTEMQRKYNECDSKEFADISDKENMELLYKPYHAFGANGTGTRMYEVVMEMPTTKKEE